MTWNSRVTQLLGIEHPIIQAGMVWCAGWELASAVSNAGCLGIIGSGSMYPEVLRTHIRKCKQATDRPFAVNVPLIYPDIKKQMQVIIKEGVSIVFTSAGNPKTWTPYLKDHGITVVHVVSSTKFARKAQEEGVDAVVAEGFEAGGHNGREETTTLCLVPAVVDEVNVPVIAAGGIGSGRAMMAAFALGAEAVQIGSRFVASEESSAHINFKNRVINAQEGETKLTLKALAPVRLIRNKFYEEIEDAENKGIDKEILQNLLGRGRAKKGMFEGDMNEGELEIGQVSSTIGEILPARAIIRSLMEEFRLVQERLKNLHL